VRFTMIFICIELCAALFVSCPAPESPVWDGNDIHFFYFENIKNFALDRDVVGLVYGTNIVCTVPKGTDITSLVPTMIVSRDAKVAPLSGVSQNFELSVPYTVTSQKRTRREYSVSVTGNLSSAKDITSFVFRASDNPGLSADAIGTFNNTAVNVIVPYGTMVKSLVPIVTLTAGSAISPPGDVARDFSNQVTYTVTAIDGTQQVYYVMVLVAPQVDITAPIPGDGGVLSFTDISGTSVTGSWSKAEDFVTPQDNLVYKVVRSTSDNISSVDDAENNGTTVTDWTREIDRSIASGLDANTQYFSMSWSAMLPGTRRSIQRLGSRRPMCFSRRISRPETERSAIRSAGRSPFRRMDRSSSVHISRTTATRTRVPRTFSNRTARRGSTSRSSSPPTRRIPTSVSAMP
jgi:hypothetical protein